MIVSFKAKLMLELQRQPERVKQVVMTGSFLIQCPVSFLYCSP